MPQGIALGLSSVSAHGRSSNGAQEIYQQSIHFRRTLLLDPMSRAGEQNLPNQVGALVSSAW